MSEDRVIERVLVESRDGYDVWRVLSVLPEFHVETLAIGDSPTATDEVSAAIKAASGKVVETLEARNAAGDYIGSPERAAMLAKRGIQPEVTEHQDKVCSIGFCAREQKWYGWSHRAIYGFGIGDEVSEGDCTASSGWTDEYLQMHPEADRSLPVGFIAKSFADARRMAVAFAESVS